MGIPSYRGDFNQEYFFSSCRYFHGVGGPLYFAVVSPS
jgi:hypothetical protein